MRDDTFKKVPEIVFSFNSIPFRFKMSRRIKEISQKFDEIAADRNKFHVATKVVDSGVLNQGREQTHSFIDESEVFGRDADKNKIINILLDANEEKSIVAIIGMGGLGKTTLAQLVHGDSVVDQIFEVKMWVGVYRVSDARKILRKILQSATNNVCPNLDMDQLRSHFQKQVKGKKILLILDDVWDELSEKWEELKFVMSYGASGSKLVVTTRSANVAVIMQAKPYNLKGLSRDDCWSVFKQRAFARGEEQPNPSMVVIGREIVDRCHGVPLAAKTLGSLMCLETTQREWQIIRDSNVWRLPQNENDIMPALRLSYNHLPVYLKPCFAYLASYEMDSLYKINDLIQSWIAHGFVRSSSEDSRSLEDLGNKYVKDLMERSLIQEITQDKCGNQISFEVHDLVYHLAKDVAGREYFCFEEGIDIPKPEEIRFAGLKKCSYSEVKKVLSSMPNLRELGLKRAFPDSDMFSRLKHLRWLSVHIKGELLPSSIGKLKHLRKFVLHSDALQTLPSAVTKLLNLQTFNLSYCPKLRKLPKDIGKMINLRHVYLLEDAPMSHFPPGLKSLTSLQTLPVFFVGKGVGCKLNELCGLIHLEGQMIIKNLENVQDASDCLETDFKNKQRLERLKFSWNCQEISEDVSREERNVAVLEALQPHSNLKILEIESYAGSRFANWMMKPLFPELLEVSLVKCGNCRNLPPFGELPKLQDLLLKDMDALKSIEGRGEHEPREWFPSLKKLMLENLPHLENWELKENFGAFSLPSLLELKIIKCPQLKNLPRLPSLERVEVNCCSKKLVQSLILSQQETTSSSFTRLKYLKIKECSDLISLPKNGLVGLVSLEKMVIEDCRGLVSLDDEELQGFMYLTSLKISSLPNLVSLPQWIQNSTKLQKLRIEFCERLVEMPDWIWQLTSLRDFSILGCDKLKSLPDGMQHLTALEELTIGECDSLMSWPNGLGSLVSLKDLRIRCSSNLPSLPEQLQQLTGIRVLVIANCQTMLGFPEWLVNFISLQQLGIYELRNLQFLPEWISKLTALQDLCIADCDHLTSRCQKGSGVDWPKIAHIPIIELNGESIQLA